MLSLLKNKLVAFLVAIGLVSVASAQVPIVERDMAWISSYETIAFDTVDGDLGLDEYAVAGDGAWYIRELPKEKGNFTATTSREAITGKTQVAILAQKSALNEKCIGCAYYSEFRSADGSMERTITTKAEYDTLRETQDAPKPKRTERVPLLSANEAGAAITDDSDTDNTGCSSCSSWSFSHTTSGSDLGLVVLVALRGFTAGSLDVTALTYNSVSMTEAEARSSTAFFAGSEIWYLEAPATGSNTVSITLGGTAQGGGANASSYNGVDQIDMFDASNGAISHPAASISYTITTVEDGAFIVDGVGRNENSNTCVPDTGQTEIWDADYGGNRGCTGYEEIVSAGSQTVGWSCSSACSAFSGGFTAVGVSIKPAGAADPSPFQETLIIFE